MSSRARIVLIHATPVAMDPVRDAFAADWPEAETTNLLDDGLTIDRARTADLTPALTTRIVALATYARDTGASGVLFTCSAFGAAIDSAARVLDVPVLKPNEAMFRQALALGSNLAMIATFTPSVAGMEAEFRELAAGLAPAARLTSVVAEGAIDALRAGDAETHNQLVAEAARGLEGYDAIMLAHFSTSRAAGAVRAVTGTPVLTSPEAAVATLRSLVGCGAAPAATA
jgi:hypothetical protein